MPRPRTPRRQITKRMVDDARPRGTRYLIFDGLVHGFALKIEPSGTKVWVVQKSQAGRSVRVTLGAYPDLTVDQARRDAQAKVASLVRGGDPTAEKRATIETRRRSAREAITAVALWARYDAEEVAAHNRPSTAALKRRMWKRRIEPAIGRLPVRDVSGTDLSGIVRGALRLDAKGNVVGGKAAAGNLHRLLHHLFAKALAWRVRPLELGHPLDGIEQPRVPRRERLLSDEEVRALLGAVSEDCGAPQVINAIRLAALTGWRIDELLTLKWSYLRRDLGEARLPATKTGFSARPLAPATLVVLDAIERRPGVPWVLPGIRDITRPLDYDTVHKAFARVARRAGVREATLHTLRHRVITDVANASPNIRVAMAVTGHKSTQAIFGYVHSERDRSQAVAAEVSGKVAALAARPSPEKIVELTPKPRVRRA
jgi:integrase